MTGPEGAQDQGGRIADAAQAAAAALVDNAKRLGLQWGLRPASVLVYDSDTDAYMVMYDGDEEGIAAINLSGLLLALDDRVMVAFVPPSGNFIIGSRTSTGLLTRIDSDSSSGAVSGETVVMTTPLASFKAGRAYMFRFGSRTVASVNGAHAQYGIRQGDDTSGTLLANVNMTIPTLGTGMQTPWIGATVYGVAETDIDSYFVLTLQASTGTMTQFANASNIRYFEIYEHGRGDDFVNAVRF